MLLNERKIELLKELEHAERTPTELSERMNLTISSVNKHLKDLEKIGLVTKTGKKEGKTRSYWKYQLKEFIYFIASLDGEIQKKEFENDNGKEGLAELVYRLLKTRTLVIMETSRQHNFVEAIGWLG